MSPSTGHSRGAHRAAAVRIMVPALWLGLVLGISFIEAPLKFTAPGITIPLGLGIGRRVFLAMNIVEILLLLALLAATFRRRTDRRWRWGVGCASALLLLKTAVIRPGLARRTDAVLAGNFQGGSLWHYAYMAAEGALTITLIWLLVMAARRWVSAS